MSYTIEQLDTAVATAVARERIRCAGTIEAYAYQFLDKWQGIIGVDRAKAGALDIMSAGRSLLQLGKE